MKFPLNYTSPKQKAPRGAALLALSLAFILLTGGVAGCAKSPATTEPAAPDPMDEERAQLNEMIESFSSAYFSGGSDALSTYLTDPYLWSPKTVYTDGSVSNVLIKGIDKVTSAEIGDVKEISVQFAADGEDSLTYLTIEAVKEADGWRVQFYGLEK